MAAYANRAGDRQHSPINIVVHLRGGSASALPCRHYGWNVLESPGSSAQVGAATPGRIEGLELVAAEADWEVVLSLLP